MASTIGPIDSGIVAALEEAFERESGIRGLKRATEALLRIREMRAPFLSRGDRSGTHVAELELWRKAGISPAGPWYQVYRRGSEGNAATLLNADQRGMHTVIDRASYLGLRGRLPLEVLVEGDEALLHHIALIPVNPGKFPRVHHRETMEFMAWLTNPDKGQRLIATYGQEKFGSALFTPESQASKPENR
jgi:tungstate transport system substrate-binding protein